VYALQLVCSYSGSRDHCDFSVPLCSAEVGSLTITRQAFCKHTICLGYTTASHSHLATRFQNACGSKGFRKRHEDVKAVVVLTKEGLKGAGKNQGRAAKGSEAIPTRIPV